MFRPDSPGGPAAEAPERARHVDQVDQRRPGAQLHEPERVDAALLAAAEHAAVETDRALDVGNAQHHVIYAAYLDRTHLFARLRLAAHVMAFARLRLAARDLRASEC
jgi:hypothetical protein